LTLGEVDDAIRFVSNENNMTLAAPLITSKSISLALSLA